MQETELHDKLVKLIIKKLDEATRELESSLLSVYSQPENTNSKPEHIGTAFFIKIKDSYYLTTAEHVIENAKAVGSIHFANKQGQWFNFDDLERKSKSLRSCKYNDLFILEIENSMADIQAITCPILDEIDVPDPCVCIGFPNSRNKRAISSKNKTGELFYLKLHLYSNNSESKKVPEPSDSAFFYKWGEKNSLSEENMNTKSLSLRGLSGAPCFVVPLSVEDLHNDADISYKIRIAGVLIEQKNDLVKFTRLTAIWNIINEKASHIVQVVDA